MAVLKLKAKLTGVGVVNNTFIYLENIPDGNNQNAIQIGLGPKNASRKEWQNTGIVINVIGTLDYQLNVHAVMGTDWTFTLTNTETGNAVLELNGTTGDDVTVGMNVSIVKGSKLVNL